MGGDALGQREKTRQNKMLEQIDAPIRLDLSVDIKLSRSNQIVDKKYKCSCCGLSWNTAKNHFSKSASPLYQSNDGYLPICNNCRDAYYYRLVDLYSGNEAHAIKHFCQQFDIIFHKDAFTASRQISADRSRISHYQAKKNLGQTARIGSTYIDGMKYEYENRQEEVIETLEEVKDSKKAKLRTVKFFGTGFTDEDYQFLENEYQDWTTRHECNTKAQEEIFKQICFAQLDILKAKRANQPTKDLTKTLQDLLDTANLKPKQTKDNTLAEQNTFGTLIRKWENEKPIPDPDPEWKDVDGIARYITVYFLGHLCKMMGIKNTYSRMYEDEMSKYKVEKPEYEDDDEALFDAVFGGELDDSN